MEEWNEGQLALFDALGKVCEKFGNQVAGDLAKSVSAADDGKTYLRELEYLRTRSGLVDDLRKENNRLRTELESASRELKVTREAKGVHEKSSAVLGSKEATSASDDQRGVNYDELLAKHQVVKNHLKEVQSARGILEDKLRKNKALAKQWMEHANGQRKKILKLESLLEARGISLKDAGMAHLIFPQTPGAVASSPILSTTTSDVEARSRRAARFLTVSHGEPGLDSPAIVGLSSEQVPTEVTKQMSKLSGPGDGFLYSFDATPLLSRSFGQENSRKGVTEQSMDPVTVGVPTKNVAPVNHRSDVISKPQVMMKPLDSSPSNDQGSTQSESEQHSPAALSTQSHESEQVKDESQDSPVVVASRAVKKNRLGTVDTSLPGNVRVKVETISSSPLQPTYLDNLTASIDLDDIGQKVNTPKKRRHISTKTSHSNISRTLKQPESGSSRSFGNPSALRATNPNLMVTPETYKAGKRRRLNDYGVSIISEDGEEEAITERLRDPSPDAGHIAAHINRRLNGLLEVSSPDNPHLIPRAPHFERANDVSTIKARSALSSMHDHFANEMLTTTKGSSLHGHPPGPISAARPTLNPRSRLSPPGIHTPITRDIPRTSASKTTSRMSRPLLRDGPPEADDADHEPLRARPIRKLRLEHFKVNRDSNQGYDFAFSDVVRGREQRKCLPGCTKPECCGQTFRKLAELTMWEQGTLTSSQEERDDRLLQEYLGDNAGQLQKMSEGERHELLVQAKARDLSNKLGRHRHAYERRKSPPGFWRSDFPNTQERDTDLEEAKKRERELVKKRYEEAMRPGGAWLFRDE